MNVLYDVLFTYASESRIPLFLHPEQAEKADNLRMVEHSVKYLESLGPDAAEHADRVRSGIETVAHLNMEAAFLAGLSMGLELGALGHS